MTVTSAVQSTGSPPAANPAVASSSQQQVPKRWSRQVAIDVVGFFDVAAVLAGGIIPAAIFNSAGDVPTDWFLVFQSSVVAAAVNYLCLRHWGMYDTQKLHDLPHDPGTLLSGLGISLLAVLGIGLPSAIKNAHLWVWYASWMTSSFTLLLLNRMVAHAVLSHFTALGRFDRRVAVFGAGHIARRVHDHLSNPAFGIRFVGVYDDRTGQDRLNPEGLVVNGKLEDLIAVARSGAIDQIVIALPQAADRRMSDVARRLEQLNVSVHIVTHIASDLVEQGGPHKVSNLGPVGMLDVKRQPLADWAPLVKRAEDLVIGGIMLALTAPLFPLIALAIKLDTPGPVFFRQRRRGLNHGLIEIVKFRTMNVIEKDDEVHQVVANDPRITRVGRFLRRTSLDELPQLFNVLKGEMSLVGPRPHALVHDEQYGEMLEQYANRHQVKPGISGLAQVRGYRGVTPQPETMAARVENDIEYIKSWSLWLDLKILVQTFWAIAMGKNAR